VWYVNTWLRVVLDARRTHSKLHEQSFDISVSAFNNTYKIERRFDQLLGLHLAVRAALGTP